MFAWAVSFSSDFDCVNRAVVSPTLLVMYTDTFLGLLFSHAVSGNCSYALGLSIVVCIEFPMARGSVVIIHCGL